MGRNSQQRRQQQQRRAQQRDRAAFSRRTAGADPSMADPARLVDIACAVALGPGADGRHFEAALELLEELESAAGPGERPSALLHDRITRALDAVLEGGWEPADVVHATRRAFTQRLGRLAAQYVAAHARQHQAVHRAPPRWLEQLAELGVLDPTDGRLTGGHADVLARWAKAERLHPADSLGGAVQFLAVLRTAGRLNPLLPPPSRWAASNAGNAYGPPGGAGTTGEIDAKALRTIRALLAKAEATTFEAEADAFTAKAQELMARHSIDAAVLAAAAMGDGGRLSRGTEARRIHIDDPYADEKVGLLAAIGHVNSVTCVWASAAGFATVVGFPVDLQLTEVLFTSLLVQATHASSHATAHDARLRTASFRRAFLVAFAERVAERLEAATRHAAETAEAEYGSSLVPVLQHRQAAVQAAVEELFPDTVPMRSRRLDAAGYHAGRTAGDRADLGAGKPLPTG